MFFRKKLRNVDKQIKQNRDFVVDSEGDAVINVKASQHSQIFSDYNFDSNEKLSSELGDFIWDKAKFVPPSKDIRIKLYTDADVEEVEVQTAIKNHFKKDYIEQKNEMVRNLIFSGIMLILGVIFLSFLLLMHKYFYNVYLEIIIEIATWVFIWEAVDSYFLRRASIRRKSVLLLKLYSSEIEVINLKKLPE